MSNSLQQWKVSELKTFIKQYKSRFPEIKVSGTKNQLIEQIDKYSLLDLESKREKDDEYFKSKIMTLDNNRQSVYLSILYNEVDKVNLKWLDLSTFSLFELNLLMDILEINTTVVSLDLSNVNLPTEIGYRIADILRIHPSLKHLYLNKCSLSPEAGSKIANALKTNTQLITLEIAYNYFNDDVGVEFAESLKYNSTLIGLILLGDNLGPKSRKAFENVLENYNGTLSYFTGIKFKNREKYLKRNEHNLIRSQTLFEMLINMGILDL